MGQPARTRRQAVSKALWISVWMLYLAGPVADLFTGSAPLTTRVLGAVGLAVYVALYFALVFRHMWRGVTVRAVYPLLVVLLALSVALVWNLGPNWLVLFIFTSVATGVVLPWEHARWAVPAVTVVLLTVGLRFPEVRGYYLLAYGLPALGTGYTMIGVQYLIRTTKELRAAREEVARLAANDERLRMARDLHDLLGHSLSLITLKSELAGRMLPGRPEDAAAQVADIERVGRQALVDVREAVTGYRRPRLAVELAGARAALRTAGITADADPALERDPALPEPVESALAWALREAVTNVVRHSGARRCTLRLTEERDPDGVPALRLTVADDGVGAARGTAEGNGLGGLRERLALSGGRLETGPGDGRGFRLAAVVPVPAEGTVPDGGGDGPADGAPAAPPAPGTAR
ncbi:sensor histidine kinase [Streptomyces catenulae]|uniref:Sensor histidine kinase n=1 Tax=Streptomyces catenulae TaxID=66875 RepID=A0ABV2YT79_9ACTN|nr:sensor histidine kinase [Streptomyces catenulae]